MNVPVYTHKQSVFEDVEAACKECRVHMTLSHVRYNKGKAKGSFGTALPFLSILDISALEVDFDQFIAPIADDLLYYRKTIILIVDEEGLRKKNAYLSQYKFIISVLEEGDVKDRMSGILTLFSMNTHLLIGWELQALTSQSITNTFVIFGTYRAIPVICNALLRIMERLHLLEAERADFAHVSLLEMLSNAMEHGNYEISFKDKNDWLQSHSDIYTLIQSKNRTPDYRDRTVTLEVAIYSTHIHFRIEDDGNGFDWRSFVKRATKDMVPDRHGHGIAMVMQYAKNLTYNAAGNSVSFEIEIDSDRLRRVQPKYFTTNNPRIALQKGETLISEHDTYTSGDAEHKIYLIVDGMLGVYRDGEQIGVMYPDDTFCGEASYLLQADRVATVIAEQPTRLIAIDPEQFSAIIRGEAFYGFFLARILASRLERTNMLVAQPRANAPKS